MKKAIRVLLVGVAYFFALVVYIPILTYIKTWMLGLPYDLLETIPVAIKFALYGSIVVVIILALGAKIKK
ncbi:hypothetical protein GCM10009552_17400 [Rothia nasimurium]|uniref:Uncharacterized protein n=1 Tax=Luteibacter anthropi TaxID=564369 RepID=A0A7X5UBC6_9GAMM|nr:hypothetical protein [Luteibacter anthropi]NII07396.1 hypothetical protein [Luteibacter anthropi]